MKNQGKSIADILRDAGQKAKALSEMRVEEASKVVIPEPSLATILGEPEEQTPSDLQEGFVDIPIVEPPAVKRKPNKIFDIITYIESNWGLGLTLTPVQKFIVKLYYFLPLEETVKTIQVTDDFNEKVRYNFTEKEYLQYLFEEGRCNIKEQDHLRRKLILPCGRRGGKCGRTNSILYTNEGLHYIGNLGDLKGPEYQPLQTTVAQEGGTRSDSAYFYNGGVQDILDITTDHGFELGATHNHRIRVLTEEGAIDWRRMDELRENDLVGIHRKINLWPTDYVDITSQKKGLLHPEAVPDIVCEIWGELLGILVGDGTWGQHYFEVSVGPYPEWLNYVGKLFEKFFGKYSLTPEKGRNVTKVRYSNVHLRRFFDRLGYNIDAKTDNKTIPWVILRSPKNVVAAFLRGLFETDGSCERGRIVSFSSASRELARQVQMLLLNFGILARFWTKHNKRFNKDYYNIELLGEESRRIFAEQIGFITDRKQKPLLAAVQRNLGKNKSDTESVPYQKRWVQRLRESIPREKRKPLRSILGNSVKENSNEDLTYPRIKRILEECPALGADPEVIEHFQEIYDAYYFYDPIKTIVPGRAHVVDLNVPNGAQFVANGITNHNTTLSSVFASYEVYRVLNLYNPQEYYGLPNGNRIQILSLATDKEQASILFNEVTTHLVRCEYFKPYTASNTLSQIQFRTPYDIERYGKAIRHENGKFVSLNGKATLRVTFKPCVAKGLRGHGNIMVILDEMAHFLETGNTSAEEIYKAVTPSMSAFSPKDPITKKPVPDEYGDPKVESRLICISSPLNRSGKFFELFQLAMSNNPSSKEWVAVQAPTWEMNPSIPSTELKSKFYENPLSYRTEFGAEFSNRVRGWIERKEDLLDCIDLEARPVLTGLPRYPYQLGLDIAVVGDGTAAVITHLEDDKVILDYHEVWYAGVDWRESNPHLGENYPTDYAKSLKSVERLDSDEIAKWMVALSKRFYFTAGLFDQWSGPIIEQLFQRYGLRFRSEFFTSEKSSQLYQQAKLLMYDKKLVLYDWPYKGYGKRSPFIEELLSLQGEVLSRNIVRVQAPKGLHDDVSDAFVRSVALSMARVGDTKITSSTKPYIASRTALAGFHRSRANNHGFISERTLPKRHHRY